MVAEVYPSHIGFKYIVA
uniref:RNA polymerase beta'' subunit n=1 Tax=Terminalia neotaliala TaxID=1799636 RepID=A0A859CPN8_9MYRT|nr:RNA polymerase beta'' subunit [Terminalia neotaliala]QKJ81587.1 RNA polymerase beta'' subunit [Terminalia neotaliala]